MEMQKTSSGPLTLPSYVWNIASNVCAVYGAEPCLWCMQRQGSYEEEGRCVNTMKVG